MYEQNQIHQQWLESLVAKLGGSAGTVHVQRGKDLYLTAAHNIPPHEPSPVFLFLASTPT
jgi:hypothetical protein